MVLAGLGVREASLRWKRRPWEARRGGGSGGTLLGLAGDAAREEASEDATMAVAKESTDADGVYVARLLGPRMRLGGREGWPSEAETNESSDEA